MKSILSKLCKTCGNCCKYMVLPVKIDGSKSEIKEWLNARGTEVIREKDGVLYVKIDLPCPHLVKGDDGWTCDWYNTENYPSSCRKFDGTKYDFLNCRWKGIDKNVVLPTDLEKSRVKGFMRTRKGRVERVREYTRKDITLEKKVREIYKDSYSGRTLGHLEVEFPFGKIMGRVITQTDATGPAYRFIVSNEEWTLKMPPEKSAGVFKIENGKPKFVDWYNYYQILQRDSSKRAAEMWKESFSKEQAKQDAEQDEEEDE